jgi:hypothetical protein
MNSMGAGGFGKAPDDAGARDLSRLPSVLQLSGKSYNWPELDYHLRRLQDLPDDDTSRVAELESILKGTLKRPYIPRKGVSRIIMHHYRNSVDSDFKSRAIDAMGRLGMSLDAVRNEVYSALSDEDSQFVYCPIIGR